MVAEVMEMEALLEEEVLVLLVLQIPTGVMVLVAELVTTVVEL